MKESLLRLANKWNDKLNDKEVAVSEGDERAEGKREARYQCAKELRELIDLLEIE